MRTLRYLEIAGSLRQRIRDGEFPSGSILPSQRDLAATFDTTIMTVRQALGILESEGLLAFTHGSGTFVTDGNGQGRSYQMQGFADQMGRRQVPVVTRVISRHSGFGPGRVGGLFPGSRRLGRLERVRDLAGVPVIFQQSYLPEPLASLVESYRPEISLYEHLSEVSGKPIINADESIQILLAPKRVAGVLKLRLGQPLLLSCRRSCSLDNQLLLYDEAYLNPAYITIQTRRQGTRSEFHFTIHTEPVSLRHPVEIPDLAPGTNLKEQRQ